MTDSPNPSDPDQTLVAANGEPTTTLSDRDIARPTSTRAAQRTVAYFIDRRSVPLDALRSCAANVPDASQRQSGDARWCHHRLRADRTKFHLTGVLPSATFGCGSGIRRGCLQAARISARPTLNSKTEQPDDPKTADADESFAGIRQLTEEYRKQNGLAPDVAVPIDAVTRSGSGLDPHISPANAALQIARISRTRGLSTDVVRSLVARHTRGRQFGISRRAEGGGFAAESRARPNRTAPNPASPQSSSRPESR